MMDTKPLCGIDEAGRGPVIGPLVMAGVCATDEQIQEIIDAMESDFGIDFVDSIAESREEWFVSEGRLSEGTFTLTNDIISPLTLEMTGRKGTKVMSEGLVAEGNILGMNIYKVKHISSGQYLFVTDKDIKR